MLLRPCPATEIDTEPGFCRVVRACNPLCRTQLAGFAPPLLASAGTPLGGTGYALGLPEDTRPTIASICVLAVPWRAVWMSRLGSARPPLRASYLLCQATGADARIDFRVRLVDRTPIPACDARSRQLYKLLLMPLRPAPAVMDPIIRATVYRPTALFCDHFAPGPEGRHSRGEHPCAWPGRRRCSGQPRRLREDATAPTARRQELPDILQLIFLTRLRPASVPLATSSWDFDDLFSGTFLAGAWRTQNFRCSAKALGQAAFRVDLDLAYKITTRAGHFLPERGRTFFRWWSVVDTGLVDKYSCGTNRSVVDSI